MGQDTCFGKYIKIQRGVGGGESRKRRMRNWLRVRKMEREAQNREKRGAEFLETLDKCPNKRTNKEENSVTEDLVTKEAGEGVQVKGG